LTTSLACTALLGLLVFALGLCVSLRRSSTKKGIGHDPSPTDLLHKLVRAHGNSTEYAPMLAILMLALGTLEAAPWVGLAMWVAVACRYLIVAGLLYGSLEQPNPMRFVGALGTYVSGIALAMGVFTSA
jgi:uncharacterized membrane protein YecN with MAPEG domain